MKVFKQGIEVKNATVVYTTSGTPSMVQIDGVYFDARAYEFKDETSKKKTKPADTKKKTNKLDAVMSTEDLKRQ